VHLILVELLKSATEGVLIRILQWV